MPNKAFPIERRIIMMEKMKKSAENIKMPDDVRERIIDKCAEIEKAERNGDVSYTDHVFTVERVKPNRIRRIVSGIAACAVLTGGIGVTGAMLHRQGNSNIASEVAQEACNVVSPFGDLSKYDYVFSAMDEKLESTEYETSGELTDFLNGFNWGEETAPLSAEERENFKGRRYVAHWVDEYYHEIEIRDNGDVLFRKDNFNLIDPTSSFEQIQILEQKYYHIDFAEFDKRVQEIIGGGNTEEPTEATHEFGITDEMIEKMTLAVYDESYSAKVTPVYTYSESSVTGENEQDMTNAMMYGLADWISNNSYDAINAPDTGKLLFNIDVDQSQFCAAKFLFFEENFYSYTVFNKDGTSDSYYFNGDCYEALELLRSAMDTEKKHTEENAAYYLPGFNFVKLNVTGNDELNRKLQDIFYGYDWQAHEIEPVDPESIVASPYSFKADVVTENGKKIARYVDVCENGYIHLCDIYMLQMSNEKWYKFDNSDILDALNELAAVQQILETEQKSEGETEDNGNLIKDMTVTFYNAANGEEITLTDQQKEDIWYIFEKYDWSEMKMPQKDQTICGDIKYYIQCYDENDGNLAQFSMTVTDNDYIIITNNNHLKKYDDFFRNDGEFTVYDCTNNCLIGSITDVMGLR